MKHLILFLISFIPLTLFSQVETDSTSIEIDERYREDQFYASITYNLINNKPNNVSQTGFSSGFHLGFIRDMPINKNRGLAIGLGLGLSSNSYNQNILIQNVNNSTTYNIIDEGVINVSRNKFTTYLIEIPFEFRWRTSTPTKFNFWRIYPGFKAGYLVYNSTKFRSTNTGDVRLSNLSDFEKLQYGLTLSVGYGTWNFHVYYGLNSIFNNNARHNTAPLDLKSLKVGFIFYILKPIVQK